MPGIEQNILNILNNTTEIDWFVIHKLSKSKFDEIEFSFIDNKEKLDEPFKTNLGYISFNNEDYLDEYIRLIKSIISRQKGNIVALANLYILIFRTSFENAHEHILDSLFKNEIGKTKIRSIFELFITSLNKHYYSHLSDNQINVYTMTGWLELFRITPYTNDISMILFSIIYLVEEKYYEKIEYQKIKNFKPLIKAKFSSIDKIKISKNKLLALVDRNQDEASYFSALLIEKDYWHSWISEDLIRILIKKYWNSIGKEIFYHTFGLGYKNDKNKYKRLKKIISKILNTEIQNKSKFNKVWLKSLKFPDDFITLFSWIQENVIEFDSITPKNKELITFSLINEFDIIANSFKKYIVSTENYSPFKSYQLIEVKYQSSLSYMLLFLITSDMQNYLKIIKSLRKIAYKIKPQFYGGYRSQLMAMNFTELLLLITFSALFIKGINKTMALNIQQLNDIIIEILLVPYIHLAERDEEIWNNDPEKGRLQFNIGKHLINKNLKSIKDDQNNIKDNFIKIFTLFDEVKIAEWPYSLDEDDITRI